METTSQRIRKSEKLTKSEHKAFLAWIKAQPTKIDAAEAIGITRPTMHRIEFSAQGQPATIQKIRNVIAQ